MSAESDDRPLDDDETAVWRGFLRWSEDVTARVERDLVTATGLSAADYRVLLRVVEAGEEMPQRRLQADLGWSATRLSHQLRRMGERGYLVRSESGVGRAVRIELTDQARELLARARGPHAASVRRHLVDRLSDAERSMITSRSEASVRGFEVHG